MSGRRSADRVFIHQLHLETVIGVYPWEREVRQTLLLDLEMVSDNRRAAATDALDSALDYAAVANRLEAFAGESCCQLVETFAERAAALILQEFTVPWVRVQVSKPGALAGAAGVGVVIERGELPG